MSIRITSYLLLLSLVIASSRLASAQTPPAAQPMVDGWTVKLELIGDREIFVEQPVSVNVAVSYKGAKPFLGALSHLTDGHSVLHIKNRHGTKSIRVDALYREALGDSLPEGKGQLYEPGYIRRGPIKILLDFRDARYVFHTPGEYTVWFSTSVWQGENYDTYREIGIQSNRITINVKEPVSSDWLARRLWRGQEQAFVLMRDSYAEAEKFPDGLDKLEELIRRYPHSSYALIARTHLTAMQP